MNVPCYVQHGTGGCQVVEYMHMPRWTFVKIFPKQLKGTLRTMNESIITRYALSYVRSEACNHFMTWKCTWKEVHATHHVEAPFDT